MSNSKFRLVILCSILFFFNVTINTAQTGCHQIDWETDCNGNPFSEGFYVTPTAYDCIGVTITNNNAILPLVLFNSSVPTGGDLDLGTPSANCSSCSGSCPGQSNDPNGGLTNCVDEGLVLITEENPTDNNGDGLEDDPDDFDASNFTLSFSAPVTISTLDFIDDSMGDIIFTYSNNTTSTVTLLGGLDNDVYSQVFNESDVISMEIDMTTSGALSVANFCYDVPGQPACDLVAPVLGSDVTICAGNDPGPIEVVTGASGTGTIMYQWQQSLTGCVGFGDIPGATSATYNPGILTQSTYFRVVISTMTTTQVCTETSNCISYIEDTACTGCTNPEVAAFALQPSCIDGVVQSDGYLQISDISLGDSYHWSLGSTFNDNGGANTYANATSISSATFPVQFGAFGNPTVTQDYTIRVYNGDNTCFTDKVVTMNEQDCIVGCNCEEYLYLNEPDFAGTGDAVHKYLVNADGTLTETGNPWFDNAAAGETVSYPHGITIDANGFIYVGEQANAGDIRKFNCDGTIHPTAANGGFSITHNGQTNLAAQGTTLYTNHWNSNVAPDYDGITAYDLCDGSYIAEVEFCDTQGANSRDWGFHIDPLTGTMYSTFSFVGNLPNHIYVYDESDFDTDPTTCISPTTLSNLPTDADLAGITTDPSGNLYIVIHEDRGLPGDPSYILKYGPAPSYTYIGSSATDALDDGTGWNRAIGILYSEVTGDLIVSTTAFNDDCVAIFDTDLNYKSQAVPAPGGGARGKGIALTKECCPTNNNQVVDISVCGEIGDQFLLSELINCDGAICESEWSPDPSNTGLDYIVCDNSIVVTSTNTCGTFTLEADGTAAAAQCGAFSIVVNLCIECVDFGDLPDTGAGTGTLNYETLNAFSGPSHIIIPGLTIGSTVDADLDGQASADALGDGADEDGFSFPSTLDFVPGGTISFPIDVTNTTGTTAHYEIWIDWNGDGDFNDANEMVADLSDDGAGNFGQTSFTINIPGNVTQDQQLGFRARLSNTDNMTPNDDVASGEVEDYLITVSCNPQICLPIGIIKN